MAGAGDSGAGGRGPRAWLSAPREIRVSAEALTWAALVFGVFLRVVGYAENRELYRDEKSLLVNLVRLEVFDFHTRLTENQLAPPGFLVLERMVVRLPVDRVMMARFFPLACGVASLFLFRAAARRFLLPYAVPIAVGLFAMSDWLVYYTAELKQCSCDLSLTLVALLLAAGRAPGAASTGLHVSPPMTARRLVALGVFGAIGIWFSYPLAFVLAAVGSYLLAVAVIRRDARGVLGLVAVGLAWVASFGVCYVVSHGILSTDRFIWNWWDFAFLRLPPRSMAELRREFWQLLNVFDSPSDVKTPMGLVPTAMLALALSVAGAWSMGRRWPGGLYLLTAPVIFVLAASVLHQYPFHGRLLIFLVPSVHMLVAEGAAVVSRPGGWRMVVVVGALLLIQPAIDALWHQFIQPLNHNEYDSHGDLRHDLLDYLNVE
jgi:hypothetical protein